MLVVAFVEFNTISRVNRQDVDTYLNDATLLHRGRLLVFKSIVLDLYVCVLLARLHVIRKSYFVRVKLKRALKYN